MRIGKGDSAIASWICSAFSAQLCPWLVGLIQELLKLMQASNQRGTCLVERPARWWPVSVFSPLILQYMAPLAGHEPAHEITLGVMFFLSRRSHTIESCCFRSEWKDVNTISCAYLYVNTYRRRRHDNLFQPLLVRSNLEGCGVRPDWPHPGPQSHSGDSVDYPITTAFDRSLLFL